jgi:hypothetical protein
MILKGGIVKKIINIIKTYTQAASVSGRSVAELLLESLKLRLCHTRLGLSEYIDFQLYRDDLTYSEKKAFGGMRCHSILDKILVDDYSRFLAIDKVTMYSLLGGYNLPIPEVRATYRSIRPSSVLSIQSAEELSDYLRKPGCLPIYIKPSWGAYGHGNVLVHRIDGENVILGNGMSEPIFKFCRTLDETRTLGWILQVPLTSHTQIRNLTQSDKISSLRIHTFLSRSAIRITKAIFKVNVGARDSDNFEHGASGNMLGAVDIATGKVVRVISGTGFNQTLNPKHPQTGMDIVGFNIPYWGAVLDLVQDAQKAFPGFICPGWDIALCEDGPKILEVNKCGDLDLSQHAYRTGFLDKEFLQLMRERDLERLLYISPQKLKSSTVNQIPFYFRS